MYGARSNEKPRVVIAGGGVAGVEALLALERWGAGLLDKTLLAAEPGLTYEPISVDPFHPDASRHYSVEEIASSHDARFLRGRLEAVDPERRVVVTTGEEVSFDRLIIAVGAVRREALSGAVTFGGQRDRGAYRELLESLGDGRLSHLTFAVVAGSHWALPLYELALFAAGFAARRSVEADIQLVTPEQRPLCLFGRRPGETVERLLFDRGVVVHPSTYPYSFDDGVLHTVPDLHVRADMVVCLPRLTGPGIEGVPADPQGFVATDPAGRVDGTEGVFAVGDCSALPVKHGSVAAQQADWAAQAIAAEVGAVEAPGAFRPVARGLLFTGREPAFMRSELTWDGDSAEIDERPLWWPPEKLTARFLGPELNRRAAADRSRWAAMEGDLVPVRVELPSELHDLHPDRLLA